MKKNMKAIEAVLPGFEVLEIPEKWTPLECIVLIKCLDEDGGPTWVFTHTENLSEEELLGALIVQTDMLRQYLLDAFRYE